MTRSFVSALYCFPGQSCEVWFPACWERAGLGGVARIDVLDAEDDVLPEVAGSTESYQPSTRCATGGDRSCVQAVGGPSTHLFKREVLEAFPHTIAPARRVGLESVTRVVNKARRLCEPGLNVTVSWCM